MAKRLSVVTRANGRLTELVKHDEFEPRELNSQDPGFGDPGFFLKSVHSPGSCFDADAQVT